MRGQDRQYQTAGPEPAGEVGLFDQKDGRPLPGCTDGGRDAGDTAAGHHDIHLRDDRNAVGAFAYIARYGKMVFYTSGDGAPFPVGGDGAGDDGSGPGLFCK